MNTVLHTIDTWGPGGAETVCVELASKLDPTRFRSCAAVMRGGWVRDALRERGLDPIVLPMGRGPIDIRYLWRLATVVRQRDVALVQSHLPASNLHAGLVGRYLGIPSVATFHGTSDVSARDRWARLKLRLIASRASRLVFVSDALRRHFSRSHAIGDERAVVVHNGIDPEQFFPAPHDGLRSELGLPESGVLVGAVGNVRPAKAYDELLRVAASLRDSDPDIRFVVAGERSEPLYGELLVRRRELRVEDRVFFLGFRPDAAAFLNGIDLYLSTSTSEGFSLTTVQAMACGLAVVATRSGGPEEIVTDGADGFLVPVGDAPAIARAVSSLALDVQRRQRFGEAGRESVLRRFTVRQMVAAYESIYDELLGPQHRSRHERHSVSGGPCDQSPPRYSSSAL